MDYAPHAPSCDFFHLLCNVYNLLSMVVVFPMFEVVQSLMKFGQSRNVGLCDLVATAKQCQLHLRMMYISLKTRFKGDNFIFYNRIANVSS